MQSFLYKGESLPQVRTRLRLLLSTLFSLLQSQPATPGLS